MKKLLLLIIPVVIICIFISARYYLNSIPYNAAENYLDARYNMNYNNIDYQIVCQKDLLDSTLKNSDYWFYKFEEDAKLFKDNKIATLLISKDIYEKNINYKDSVIKARIKYNIKSDVVNSNLNQDSYLELEIFVKRLKWNKCVIDYIKELDYFVELKPSGTSENDYGLSHDHINLEHDENDHHDHVSE